jgi:hypothetical protein
MYNLHYASLIRTNAENTGLTKTPEKTVGQGIREGTHVMKNGCLGSSGYA